MSMSATEILNQARDVMTVKRVFSEPYEQDGATVVFAAKVAGGGGAGSGGDEEGNQGSGGGFGAAAAPAGVYVIKNGEVTWQPYIDVNRVILGGQLVAIAALLLVRSIVKARAKAARRA